MKDLEKTQMPPDKMEHQLEGRGCRKQFKGVMLTGTVEVPEDDAHEKAQARRRCYVLS